MRHNVCFAAFLFFGMLLAVPGGSRAIAADQPDEPSAYRLDIGDKVTIAVSGQSELSGDFIIDMAGNVNLPLLGAVRVTTLSLDECQRLVAERLSSLLKRPVVSVRVAEFRPVYVIGDVQLPGAHPFRFGLRAAAAIGLAGGFKPKQPLLPFDVAALLTAQEKVETVSGARNAALIRLARIRAELAGQKELTPPQFDKTDTESGLLASLVKDEQAALTASTQSHENAIDLLQRQQPRLQSQAESVRGEIGATEQQLAATKQFLDRYATLSEAGYGRRLTEFELERQRAESLATIHRLRAELSRLEISGGDLEIRMEDLRRERQARLNNELRDTEARLLELQVNLASARQMLKLRREQYDNMEPLAPPPSDYELKLTRASFGVEPKTIAATTDVMLNPGDILEVRAKLQPGESKRPAVELSLEDQTPGRPKTR